MFFETTKRSVNSQIGEKKSGNTRHAMRIPKMLKPGERMIPKYRDVVSWSKKSGGSALPSSGGSGRRSPR